MIHGSLFSGFGGFDLAARWMGWENAFHVERHPYCQKVLKKNFPNSTQYGDIREMDGTIYRGAIGVISGGFPCQPFSVAGNRKGEEDDRFLWPEMLRIVREIQPPWVVGENVAGLASMDNGRTLERILSDLEGEGYKLQPFNIPAGAVKAWHKRERIWVIAWNPDFKFNENLLPKRSLGERDGLAGNKIHSQKWEGMPNSAGNANYADASNSQSEQGYGPELEPFEYKEPYTQQPRDADFPINTYNGSIRGEGLREEEIPKLRGIQRGEDGRIYAGIGDGPHLFTPVLCRGNDGVPDRMERLRGLGNAIVPQVAYEIFKAISDH